MEHVTAAAAHQTYHGTRSALSEAREIEVADIPILAIIRLGNFTRASHRIKGGLKSAGLSPGWQAEACPTTANTDGL
jgi:hypothetical protein